MTTVNWAEVTCAACGATSQQSVLGSTSTFGACDLDLRPPEMARSALWVEVQECPACGYCASELDGIPRGVEATLASLRYRDALAGDHPDLARRFLRASIVAEDAGLLAGAGWFALKAAWACDDEEDAAGAGICRAHAVDAFRAASTTGERYAQDATIEAGVLSDVLRRMGRYHEAAAVCEANLASAEDVAVSVLAFTAARARLGDSAVYTVRDAVVAIPPPDEEDVLPVPLDRRFQQAVDLALELHTTQPRKGTRIPYTAHLLAVTALVLEDGGNEDEAIAAVLHDAVEDAGGAPMLEQIRQTFGDNVAAIVEACSDTDEVPKPPWRQRKERYLEHLHDASPSAARVSLADKLHNARAITRDLRLHGEEVWRRFKPGSDQLWYYRTLATTFREISRSPMVEELEREVDRLEVLAIAGALRRLVAFHDLGDFAYHNVIVTGDAARNYFVQFAVDEGGLFCEAAHNMYLEDADRLTSDQVGELLELGWQPPDHPDQNLYRTFRPQTDAELVEIAELSLRALREVYRIPPRGPIELTASWRLSPRDRAAQYASIPDEPFDFGDYLVGIEVPNAKMLIRPVALFVCGGLLGGARAVLGQLRDSGDALVPTDAVVVDPLEIRALLPEWQPLFEATDPSACSALRAETIHLARTITDEACGRGLDVILIGVGAGDEGEFHAIMQAFTAGGYEVRVLLADAPVDLELTRNEERSIATGLRYDPDTVEHLSIEVVRRYEEWSQDPEISYSLYSTAADPDDEALSD